MSADDDLTAEQQAKLQRILRQAAELATVPDADMALVREALARGDEARADAIILQALRLSMIAEIAHMLEAGGFSDSLPGV